MTRVPMTDDERIEKGGIANRRFKTASVMMTPPEWEDIARAAAAAGRPVAVWLRETGLAAARQAPAQQVLS